MRKTEDKRIVLTRSAEDCADWAGRLETLGYEPVILPCIDCETFAEPALRHTLADETGLADWLVFTSRRGVEAFVTLHAAPLPADTKIAAVGKATAAAARALLGRIDLTGRGGTAAALADELQSAIAERAVEPPLVVGEAAGAAAADRTTRDRLLLVVAENAAGTLEKKLGHAGISRRRVNVYRTVPASPADEKTTLSSLAADGVFLASPTAVEGFVNRVDIDVEPKLVTIGPSTSAVVRARGLEVAAEAPTPGLEGMLEAMQCLN